MIDRLIDRIWSRIANRYDGDDGGDCGCGPVFEEADVDSQTVESETDQNSEQGNTI